MARRLFDAVKDYKIAQLKSLIYVNHMDINSQNNAGENCVIEALRIEDNLKRWRMFKFLIKCGIDVHSRDLCDRDALEWSVKLGREKEAFHLVNGPMNEYDYSHQDLEGSTVLHHAVTSNMPQIVNIIVTKLKRYYSSVDTPDKYGITPYLHAKRLGYENIALTLKHGGACAERADYSVRGNADHWVKVGLNERKKNDVKKAVENIINLKINGKLPKLQKKRKTSNNGVKRISKNENYSESGENNSMGNQSGYDSVYSITKTSSSSTPHITNLLSMKNDGIHVDQFVHSIPIDTGEATNNSSNSNITHKSDHSIKLPVVHSNRTLDITRIFDIVSEQMTKGYCKGVVNPDLSMSMLGQKKKYFKSSTLAIIMGKHNKNTQKRKNSNNTRKTSKANVKDNKSTSLKQNGAVLPSITTTAA